MRMTTSSHQISDAARRRALNLSIPENLIREARACDLNLSKFLEEKLVEELRRRRQNDWLEANREAIDHYNERVGKGGVFSEGLRRF